MGFFLDFHFRNFWPSHFPLVTPWSGRPPEQLRFAQLTLKFPTSDEIPQRFIATFMKTQWSILSEPGKSSSQSHTTFPFNILFKMNRLQCLSLQTVPYLKVFRLQFCMHFLPLPCVLYRIHLDMITLILFEGYKLWISSLRRILTLLLLSLFSVRTVSTLPLCTSSSLEWVIKLHTYKNNW